MRDFQERIVYEDNHLLALNKPSGLLTQDSGTGRDNLEDLAKAFLKERDKKPGNVFLHVVHRLDRPVSGLVLAAKTSKALSRLNEAMRQRKLCKRYFALVKGVPVQTEGSLEHWLLHKDHQAYCVSSEVPGAQRAKLKYQVLANEQGVSLLDIELETGRYHQIRVQLATMGHPIWGDVRYGGPLHKDQIISLHHYRLSFPHPVSRKEVVLTLKAPPYWVLQP